MESFVLQGCALRCLRRSLNCGVRSSDVASPGAMVALVALLLAGKQSLSRYLKDLLMRDTDPRQANGARDCKLDDDVGGEGTAVPERS